MDFIRSKIEEYGGIKKVFIKAVVSLVFAYLLYDAFLISAINPYDESWKSLFTRHIEVYLTKLGFTVNEWSISIFMGSSLGLLLATLLHARDYVRYIIKRRQGQYGSLYMPIPTQEENVAVVASEHSPIFK
jgi:hypothetical protein